MKTLWAVFSGYNDFGDSDDTLDSLWDDKELAIDTAKNLMTGDYAYIIQVQVNSDEDLYIPDSKQVIRDCWNNDENYDEDAYIPKF